jgi:hypothetical protein
LRQVVDPLCHGPVTSRFGFSVGLGY